MSTQDDTQRRRSFACPARSGEMRGIDLAFLHPSEPDDRRFLILADHPELQRAVEDGVREIKLHGHAMNPQLHITLHEVVANQLWDDNPKEVWRTAQRLLGLGYDRHEVLHMLASVVSGQLWDVLREHHTVDAERYDAALRQLPDSWEAMRAGNPARGPRPRTTGAPRRRRRAK